MAGPPPTVNETRLRSPGATRQLPRQVVARQGVEPLVHVRKVLHVLGHDPVDRLVGEPEIHRPALRGAVNVVLPLGVVQADPFAPDNQRAAARPTAQHEVPGALFAFRLAQTGNLLKQRIHALSPHSLGQLLRSRATRIACQTTSLYAPEGRGAAGKVPAMAAHRAACTRPTPTIFAPRRESPEPSRLRRGTWLGRGRSRRRWLPKGRPPRGGPLRRRSVGRAACSRTTSHDVEDIEPAAQDSSECVQGEAI